MIKFNTALVAAALLISGGAMAASAQPVAGNVPVYSQPVAASSTLERAAVEAQAAAQRPAAGNLPFVAQADSGAAAGAVEALAQRPAAGNAPYAS
jgi:hypothetical protein